MIDVPKAELINRNEILTDDTNPNVMDKESYEALKEVIKKYGFIIPIITNKDLKIADGFHRWKAARDLGIEEVPVIRLDVDEVDRRLLRQVLNKLHGIHDKRADMADFSWLDKNNGISELLAYLPNQNKQIKALLDKIALGDAKEESFNPEEALEKAEGTDIKSGDMFQLGDHILRCGDATKEEDVLALMGDTKANLCVTDPPYNVDYTGKTKDALKIENDKKDDKAFFQFLLDAHSNMNNSMEDGGALYVFHADSEGLNFRKAFIDAGFLLKQCCIWVKDSMVMGRQDYHWQHEPILYGWKDGASHTWYTDRKQTTVWDFKRPTSSQEHPTMKPLDLVSYPIQNSSQAGQVVLDLFGGSGSTLMACEQLARKCRMMELDPTYCQVIIDRWEKYTNKKAVKI